MNIHDLAAAPNRTHATEMLAEADRLMTICNSCRYCEGLCAVFPAMELRRDFADGDLRYLANLCHGCGACLADCQFAPPHEFAVNVPKTLAIVRAESYRTYAWPTVLQGLFERNGLAVSLIAAFAVAAFVAGFVGFTDPAILFGAHAGEGAFYRVMPHAAMAGLFLAVSVFAAIAILFGLRRFWKDSGQTPSSIFDLGSLWQAVKDAATLRYLDGGGVGCMNEDEQPTDRRRLYHHLTFYGFVLCFASTSVASAYHYFLGREAPYAWFDLPVLLGNVGGVGLIVGPLGLLWLKFRRDPELTDSGRAGMDVAFVVMLLLTGATGILLFLLRETVAMGLTLAVHLGVVLGLMLTMPYGKFVHGLYRFLALVKYAGEKRRLTRGG